jgi:hypothetical protein
MNLPQNTLALSATLLEITRRFFQHAISASFPDWAWNPDPLKTKMAIELAFNIRTEEVQTRPAIGIQRGTFSTQRTTFGDRGQIEYPGTSNKDIYSKQVLGTINLNVYSLEGGEAEGIANLLFEMLVAQEQLLEQEFKFKWLGDVSVGPVGLLEEDRTVHVVPVSLSPVVYDFAWMNTPQGPLLKKLGLDGTVGDAAIKTAVYNEFYPTLNNK